MFMLSVRWVMASRCAWHWVVAVPCALLGCFHGENSARGHIFERMIKHLREVLCSEVTLDLRRRCR